MNETHNIDGARFIEMLRGGAENLSINSDIVNELNVFPIPDGDTGDNMARTIGGGVSAVSNMQSFDVDAIAKAAAEGMLLAARGNSGVILSQFFDGMSRGLEGVTSLEVKSLKKAMDSGVKQAYAAVVRPAEGTILTVMREATEKASTVDCDAPIEKYFDIFTDELYASLDRTPELLPVLKEAGVIDSGGAGFAYIIEGMRRALDGEIISAEVDGAKSETAATDNGENFTADSPMQFGYCTELIVQLRSDKTDVDGYDVNELIKYLDSIGGESIVAFKTGTRIKLHVHTFEPDRVLAYCRGIGEFVTVKIENMSIQHSGAIVRNRFGRQSKSSERKKFACVAVADGAGLISQFKDLGADYVIDGKQTMNPSTGDFIAAFDAVNADTVFVMPNNSNIVLAANQAAAMYSGSKIVVVPTTTLAQGFSALSMLDYSSGDVDGIAAALTDAAAGVVTGLVTYSIRDCRLNGRDVKKGDYIGFADKTLVSSASSVEKCACDLLAAIDMSDKSVVVAIKGNSGVDGSVVDKIAEYMANNHPDMEFYDLDGGQDVYSLIFVVE